MPQRSAPVGGHLSTAYGTVLGHGVLVRTICSIPRIHGRHVLFEGETYVIKNRTRIGGGLETLPWSQEEMKCGFVRPEGPLLIMLVDEVLFDTQTCLTLSFIIIPPIFIFSLFFGESKMK